VTKAPVKITGIAKKILLDYDKVLLLLLLYSRYRA